MKARLLLSLLPKYSNCPRCGSSEVGGGYGNMEIKEKLFIRNCNCGFSIVIDEDDELKKGSVLIGAK